MTKPERITIRLDEELLATLMERSKVECRTLGGEALYLIRRGLESLRSDGSGQARELADFIKARKA